MKLKKAIIANFKGIKEPTTILFSDFNVIVGQNDAGKSTILKALDCFLNENAPKADDLNNTAENVIISIELFFDPETTPIIIDENVETTFEAEDILTADNLLAVRKDWDTSKAKITSETSLLRKKYDTNDCLLLTETNLIALCEQLNIATQKANNDSFNNVEKRLKIREYNKQNNIRCTFLSEKLPTTGTTRLKIIGDNLKKTLPRFEYFKADTSLSETDTTIQNFFKKLAEKTIAEIDTDSIEVSIEQKLSEVLEKITNKINQVVDSAESVKPVIEFDWSKLVQTSFKSSNADSNVPLGSRGDGFRRITMMSYFEYLAEQRKTERQNIIFGFEEPETFLHPSGQEKLFGKLFAMSSNYQVVISTHSPIIVSNTDRKDISHVYRSNGMYIIRQNIEDIKAIAQDLGITVDNQFITLFDKSKILFLVEGIDDANAFRYVASTYKQNNIINQDFGDIDVAIIPVGGCDSIKHWITLDLLNMLNKPYFIFQDSDKLNQSHASPTKQKLLDEGLHENIEFVVSKKRNLENYIPASVLNRIVPGAGLNYGDFDNVKQICAHHPMAGQLGGKGVADRHFSKMTFIELRSSFFDGNEDEFISIFNKLTSLIPV